MKEDSAVCTYRAVDRLPMVMLLEPMLPSSILPPSASSTGIKDCQVRVSGVFGERIYA